MNYYMKLGALADLLERVSRLMSRGRDSNSRSPGPKRETQRSLSMPISAAL